MNPEELKLLQEGIMRKIEELEREDERSARDAEERFAAVEKMRSDVRLKTALVEMEELNRRFEGK